jgi:hypothetical protein
MSKSRRDNIDKTFKKLFQSISKAQSEVMHKSSADIKPNLFILKIKQQFTVKFITNT